MSVSIIKTRIIFAHYYQVTKYGHQELCPTLRDAGYKGTVNL